MQTTIRRKLAIERLLDGETFLVVNHPHTHKPVKVDRERLGDHIDPSAHRFVFDWGSVSEMGRLSDDDLSTLCASPPYEKMWFEIVAPDTFAGMMCCGGKVKLFFGDSCRSNLVLLGGFDIMGGPSSVQHDFDMPDGKLVNLITRMMRNYAHAVSMLNLKGGVDLTASEVPPKLNLSRKKRGKLQLLPFTYVNLSGVCGAHEAVDNGHLSAKRGRHFVRGHFKHRQSGIFWWKAHLAGEGDFCERRAYMVGKVAAC